MSLEQLIAPEVPVLVPEDTGVHALDLMEETKFPQLPLVSNDNYTALVQENDVLDWKTPNNALSGADFLNYKPAIFATGHPFEALRIVHQMNLTILPVIDAEGKYLGSVTKDTLLKYITENSGIDAPGGIIVLEVPPRDYTLYDVARICESEDAIILNAQVHPGAAGMLEITLKLNRVTVEGVVASLERHKYHVKEVHGENVNKDDINYNYNLLMNYINM
jgi:CBS domain-containing protein